MKKNRLSIHRCSLSVDEHFPKHEFLYRFARELSTKGLADDVLGNIVDVLGKTLRGWRISRSHKS